MGATRDRSLETNIFSAGFYPQPFDWKTYSLTTKP